MYTSLCHPARHQVLQELEKRQKAFAQLDAVPWRDVSSENCSYGTSNSYKWDYYDIHINYRLSYRNSSYNWEYNWDNTGVRTSYNWDYGWDYSWGFCCYNSWGPNLAPIMFVIHSIVDIQLMLSVIKK